MMALRSGGNDWATIGHGMVDFTTPFSVYDVNLANAETFYNRTNLQAVTIKDDTGMIGNYALRGCSSLTQIIIPASITYIGNNAFANCSSLSYIICERTTPPTLNNSNAFNSTNNCPIYVPDASVATYKAANMWSSLASRIFSINDMP